jgi:hypothetical protein
MIDWGEYADTLLEEFALCCNARPMHNAVEVCLEKDGVAKFAYRLATIRSWGEAAELEAACTEFAPKLHELEKKLVFDILRSSPPR